jgi:hypothetical protein
VWHTLHPVPCSLLPVACCLLLAHVSAITSGEPQTCYCSFTPGEIREFGVRRAAIFFGDPPPPQQHHAGLDIG